MLVIAKSILNTSKGVRGLEYNRAQMSTNEYKRVQMMRQEPIAQARVPFLRALITLILMAMRPDAHGGWRRGCAFRV